MVGEEEGNEERKNRGRKGNLKKKVSLILLVIIVFPATCEKFTVPAVCRERLRSNTAQGHHKIMHS